MSCERCGQAPGAITYTEYGEEGARKLRICPACARELGFDVRDAPPSSAAPPSGAEVVGKVVGILGIETVVETRPGTPEPEDPRECPGCGMTGRELRRAPLFGCPMCYETFEASLDPLFRRLHNAVAHRGRMPGGRTVLPVDPEVLRRDLREAIANEDFEKAAQLRDRLRRANEPSGDEPREGAS